MWKEILWTEGMYSASDDGKIKSNDRLGADGRRLKGKILKPWIGNHGYLTVCLRVGNKNYRKLVHRLIAETFIGEGNVDVEIDHKDGNKLNNSADNLEWVTRKENLERAKNLGLINVSEKQKLIRSKISVISRELQKKSISQYTLDGTLIKTYDAVSDACRENGYDISAIGKAASGKQKTSYGYIWKWNEKSVTTIPQGSSCTGENPAAKDENF
jgi:hypothetical protein